MSSFESRLDAMFTQDFVATLDKSAFDMVKSTHGSSDFFDRVCRVYVYEDMMKFYESLTPETDHDGFFKVAQYIAVVENYLEPTATTSESEIVRYRSTVYYVARKLMGV